MSWLVSVFIAGLIYTSPGSFSDYSAENLMAGMTPQMVVTTPQSVLQGDETERFEQTYPLSANGKVSVSNVNGSIVIEAWDRNEVKLEAVKIADSKERLSQVQIKIDARPDSLKVETEYGIWKNGSRNWNCSGICRLEVQYKLMVPRTAVLNQIDTVNGSVIVSNMTNITKVSAVNGAVKATNLRGTANIGTVNGTSEVSFEKLDSNSNITLSTVNGRVNLTIPSDTDATVKADTVNGSISNEFNLPIRKGKYVGKDLYAKLGDGSVKINLNSVNGGLAIKRQQDGKNTKSVTNLLSGKSEDEDQDESADTSVSRMNRDIAKSVRNSNRVAIEEARKVAEQSRVIVAQAMKESMENTRVIQKAQRDALKINRDIARINREFGANFVTNWADFGSSRVEEQSDTFPVKGTPRVTVDAKNCAVSVRGWNRDEVKYRITKLVRGALSPDVNVSVSNTETEVMINAGVIKKSASQAATNGQKAGDEVLVDLPPVGIPSGSVRIEVFVPKKSNLRILTDREIRVEGVSGNIDLTGNDSAINVRDSEGKLKIVAGDAIVRVIGFSGEVDSRTIDGTNLFEGLFQKFSASSANGIIILTLPEDTNADIQANAKIQTEGFASAGSNGDETRHRLGEGGKTYRLNVEDGQILIRNANLLNAK